jgi:hypothetical protein
MPEFSSEKAKLTLGIDKEVIKKAKAAGINISSITEQLLKAMTFEPKNGVSYDDVIKSYESFLDAIKKILRKYDLSLTIGEKARLSDFDQQVVEDNINLDAGGGLYLWNDEIERAFKVSVNEVFNDLYPVNKILNDLITKLIEVTEDSKIKLQELNFALKLLNALSQENDQGETDK